MGFLRTRMKLLGKVIEHDPKSIFRYGATWDLTFGDLLIDNILLSSKVVMFDVKLKVSLYGVF